VERAYTRAGAGCIAAERDLRRRNGRMVGRSQVRRRATRSPSPIGRSGGLGENEAADVQTIEPAAKTKDTFLDFSPMRGSDNRPGCASDQTGEHQHWKEEIAAVVAPLGSA